MEKYILVQTIIFKKEVKRDGNVKKIYSYSLKDGFTSNPPIKNDNFDAYLNVLNYYIHYFKDRIGYFNYKYQMLQKRFNSINYASLDVDAESFFNIMSNLPHLADNYQEYVIYEDEDCVALSYVGDVDFYELQEKRWMIMLDECSKIYFVFLEDEFDDNDEYRFYYNIIFYAIEEDKYTWKQINYKTIGDIGISG